MTEAQPFKGSEWSGVGAYRGEDVAPNTDYDLPKPRVIVPIDYLRGLAHLPDNAIVVKPDPAKPTDWFCE